MRKFITALFLTVLFVLMPSPLAAQEPSLLKPKPPAQYEAVIKSISDTVEVTFLSGPQKNTSITFPYSPYNTQGRNYKAGDNVIIATVETEDGTQQFYLVDFVRRDAIYKLGLLFIAITIFVARKKGFASLLSMCFAFAVIFKFLLPQILAGQNPIVAAIIACIAIVPVTYYVSHGFNKKTHTAAVGTILALIATSVLAQISIDQAKLTGFATEDAVFLSTMVDQAISMKGLLLAGIIIGLLGILDDITVSQAAIVFKLKENAPHLSPVQVYQQAMDIGRDHIGSVVNTLILVYAGAALPFLLLFIANEQSYATVINFEQIAEEIVRTLVASIGLILAVPITTALASLQKK